tara:strand:- start:330 stop:710 length:381 start_codon:yes stop_codon:yes gene_type:complete
MCVGAAASSLLGGALGWQGAGSLGIKSKLIKGLVAAGSALLMNKSDEGQVKETPMQVPQKRIETPTDQVDIKPKGKPAIAGSSKRKQLGLANPGSQVPSDLSTSQGGLSPGVPSSGKPSPLGVVSP